MANPSTFAVVPGSNPIQDYLKEIEKLLKRHKLGKFADRGSASIDDATLLSIETRLNNVEKRLGILNNERKIDTIDE